MKAPRICGASFSCSNPAGACLTPESNKSALTFAQPGRIQYDGTNKLLTIAYRAGDPPSQEKCRVMINSWPLPARRNLTWDLSFKLGGDLPGEAWPMTPATVSPKLLWQIKNDNYETSASRFPQWDSL